jgi:GNAT superfamily N-acetyltransferase
VSERFVLADYNNPEHAKAVVEATNAYAQDKMGIGKSLPDDVLGRMVEGMRRLPQCFSILAFVDNRTAGVANCVVGYSTFSAAPLVNIHDLSVLPEFRGRGIGKKLMLEVEKKALELGCKKLTLEVRTDNPAEKLYRSLGFTSGFAEFKFLTKTLNQ